MIKRMIVMLLCFSVVAAGVAAFKWYGNKMMMQAMSAMGNPVQTVSTMKAISLTWQDELKAVGTLRAVKGADLSSEVAGTVENVFLESGQDISEGTVLLQLRSAEDYATLQSLIASTRLAELNVQRDQKMLEAKAISQAAYDTDIATLENLKAQVEAQKAKLEKKTIVAPFSGQLGIRQVDVGEYLNAGTPIVTLQQLDPIYLDFFVPQQKLGQLKIGQKLSAKSDAAPDTLFDGEITAIESKVDENTRNVEVRALLHNPDKLLRPGMFATVAIASGEPQSFITLPQTAITFNPYGSTVFIVKSETTETGEKLTANTAFVTTGQTRGDQVTILAGVAEGDEVVTAGQMKLHNGSTVTINNKIQPSNDAAPTPKGY